MTWTAFLLRGDGPAEPADVGVPTAHDILLSREGIAVRVLEVADDAAVSVPGSVELTCALNRHEPSDDVTDSMWSGLVYPLKAGAEDTVAKIFAESGRPDHEVKDDAGAVVGRLLRTVVFVGPEIAIRVIEVDGDLRTVSRHMSRQEPVRAFERQIEQHLAVPRDMVTPEGAEKFFRDSGLRAVRVTTGDR